MAHPKIRSVLRGIDFEPQRVFAVKYGRDRYGRQQFVPIVESTLR